MGNKLRGHPEYSNAPYNPSSRTKRDYIAMVEAQQEKETLTENEQSQRSYRLQEREKFKYGTDHEIEQAAVEQLSAYSIKQAKTMAKSVAP